MDKLLFWSLEPSWTRKLLLLHLDWQVESQILQVPWRGVAGDLLCRSCIAGHGAALCSSFSLVRIPPLAVTLTLSLAACSSAIQDNFKLYQPEWPGLAWDAVPWLAVAKVARVYKLLDDKEAANNAEAFWPFSPGNARGMDLGLEI